MRSFSIACLCCACLFLFPRTLRGQEDVLITGKVLDEKTRLPLDYATVSIKGKGIGTVTNGDGSFEFPVPSIYFGDTLSVSMLGYARYETVVSSLDKNVSLIIALKESPIRLDEVVVASDTLSANGIFKRAFKNLTSTFSQENVLKGSYRQINTESDKNVFLLEAAVEIQNKGYKLSKNFALKEKIYVNQVRSSVSNFQNNSLNYFEESNTLADLLIFNYTRYENHYVMERTNFTLDSVMQVNDRQVYVISSFVKGDQLTNRFTLYIDTETFAFWIIRNESIALPGKFLQNFDVFVKDRSQVLKLVASRQEYWFDDYQGKMYLSRGRCHYKGQIIDVSTGKVVEEVTDENILIINEIQTGKINASTPAAMDRKKNLKSLDRNYNADFWKDYNLVKLSPLTKKQISDLESTSPLEVQFKTKK